MSKTDKELAAEITMAIINTNPKTVSPINGTVSWGINLKAAESIYEGMYNTIHALKD